ncbi:MAG: ScyD/ScyE family protein [Acidimicrobiia bacterium]|nr:ScyD/ScyE family protein [Acidimicrobiia bacterium]MDH3463791.1 ScyD/ScyE family protein [Acidimicrobiia bacterium]
MTNSMKRIAVIAVALALVAGPAVGGAVGGFNGPLFGLSTAPNGALLLADASTGVIPIRNDIAGSAITLPGVTDISPVTNTVMWATTGAGENPEEDTGQALYQISRGQASMVANLYTFEATSNPDGNDPFDSNPFDVQSLGSRSALVVDAGGNDLLRVSDRGQVRVLAVFPDSLVSTANLKSLAGCPEPGPFVFFCDFPAMMPAQSTPTSVAIGPDGYYYVGELRGFPAPTNASSIWRVSPRASWAQCGSSPDCVKVFDGGFTSIIDLAFGPDGNLYVAELDEGSWAAVEIFQTPLGGTVSSCSLASLTCSDVATGLPMLTTITFGKDGSLWAAQNALIPGLAEVVQLP